MGGHTTGEETPAFLRPGERLALVAPAERLAPVECLAPVEHLGPTPAV